MTSMNHERNPPITFETVVPRLFGRFPILQDRYDVELQYMGDEPLLAYIVFGTLVIPFLESALRSKNAELIASISTFFEECAEDAKQSPLLGELLSVEIGEWLGGTNEEEEIAPYLGPETKRICQYVPGLAMQRWKLKVEQHRSSFRQRLARLFKR
jgi:hypothetical protein